MHHGRHAFSCSGSRSKALIGADSVGSVAGTRRSYPAALVTTALAYALCHHVGTLPSGLGPAGGGTRWADWIDLLTPVAVLIPAALTLRAAQASASLWALFGAGVLCYVEGHGVHLAANSVSNAAPGETAHLWDEVVGHYVWYLGVAVVATALALTMRGRSRPTHPVAYLLAVGAGLTWATNAIGGGTAVLSLLLSAAAIIFGWRHRSGLPVLLAVGGLPSVILIATYLSGSLGEVG